MNLPTIKTYRPDTKIPPHTYYILNKGKNSGKPLDQPCPNSYMVSCCDPESRNTFYWLCFILWKSNAYYPDLRGSVIDYITIGDFKSRLFKAYSKFSNPAVIIKASNQMQRFDAKSKQLKSLLLSIEKLKIEYLRSIISRT